MTKHACIALMAGGLALSALSGCTTPKKDDAPPVTAGKVAGGLTGNPNEPDWVSNPRAAYPGSAGELLLATGSASMKSLQLAREAAAKRAKRTVAETLMVKIQGMTTDYQSSAQDFADETGESESAIENVESVQRSIVDESLMGCVEDMFWRNDLVGDKYEIHALVALKWGEVSNSYKEKMSAAIRERFREKSAALRESALGKLDEQLDRENSKGFGE